MKQLESLAKKLSSTSVKIYPTPSQRINWIEAKELKKECWFTSPEFISLYGTDIYKSLSQEQKYALSFWEAVNFYSLNINGEIPLIKGISERLFKIGNESVVEYLHHFIDEENKHMQYFGKFCIDYAGKVYPDKKLAFAREYQEGEEEFLFYLKIMIFEEISDHHNIKQSQDENIHEISKQINFLHHQDEARHLIFGRQIVKELFEEFSPMWDDETKSKLRLYIQNYITSTWKEYYNPEVYRDAGLAELGFGTPYDIFQTAYSSEHALSYRKNVSEKFVKYLLSNNILLEEPAL